MGMNKRMVLRKLLVVEVVIFIGYYLFGVHGLQAIKCIKRENGMLQESIVHMQKEIAGLENDIVQWDTNLFYKEKIAREQLQLAREGDEIYYLS